MTKLKNLIICDLDGVITSEEAYWDCAGLTLHELLYSPRYWNLANGAPYRPAANARESREVSRTTLPEWLILSFKARALNSNWDTCYAAICLHLITLLKRLPNVADLQPFAPWDDQWLASLRAAITTADLARTWDNETLHQAWRNAHPFDLPIFHGATGLELFERLDAYVSDVLGLSVEGVFSRHGLYWRFCRDLFQEWLLGDPLYEKTLGHAPAQSGKPGCIFFEEPLLPVEQLHATLGELHTMGYTLGIASGRVRQEAAQPLEKYDLWRYFDSAHIGTYDLATWGEAKARARGQQATFGKPHPFQFQAAVNREDALLQSVYHEMPAQAGAPFIAVGDSTSDILSGNGAGGLTIAVLTGARSPEARELLLKSLPDFVIADITKLPDLLNQIDSLETIQQLQFEKRETAEKLLRLWFVKHMELATESVRLTPKATSLNSFNGFYQSAGQEYFFKTHVETLGVLDEYYHAEVLDKAGYNVVRPIRLLREKERQMVVYPVVKSPVMFDLMRAHETGQQLPDGITAETLIEAERAERRRLLQLYAQTYEAPRANPPAAPIHQLFWHRLTGERYRQFYREQALPLPTASEPRSIAFEQLLNMRWTVNGVAQKQTLGELVKQARNVLNPDREVATIIGHGDAHFGNVFLEQADEPPVNVAAALASAVSNHSQEAYRYLYFDPAFAGRHSPLLDIVKPLFHNIFAMWMYFSREIAQELQITVKLADECISVEHNYRLTPIRQALLHVKQEELVKPLVAWLREQHALPEDWRELLNLALMCCPLLTVNPFDTTKRTPEIGWLGLSQAVQLGNGELITWKEDER